ncbi:unnamed protein product [Mytilus edulis]|uniref:B box-type domain-containing protein n=1 Tax=Mytilus edulis TaxID=6550 RepID=A0A8S3RQY3_MYTED|nr:unnamed protein product [Mytilus edulis]
MACNSPLCGICDFKQKCVPSTAWCFECNEGLCDECKEHHILNKASKSHGIIPVNEFQKLPCLIGDHRNCQDLTDINDVVCRIKSSNMMLEIENSMREVTADLQRIQKNRAGNLLSLKLHRQTIKQEIQKARQTVNNHFDRLGRTLLKELHIIENNERKKISKILASVERKEKEIDELQKSLVKIKQNASNLQTYLISKQIEHALMESESLIKSIQNNNELSDVIISFQTNDMMKSLENISNFWKIVVQTSQSNISLVDRKTNTQRPKLILSLRATLIISMKR